MHIQQSLFIMRFLEGVVGYWWRAVATKPDALAPTPMQWCQFLSWPVVHCHKGSQIAWWPRLHQIKHNPYKSLDHKGVQGRPIHWTLPTDFAYDPYCIQYNIQQACTQIIIISFTN